MTGAVPDDGCEPGDGPAPHPANTSKRKIARIGINTLEIIFGDVYIASISFLTCELMIPRSVPFWFFSVENVSGRLSLATIVISSII
jgi:hypothetical protein